MRLRHYCLIIMGIFFTGQLTAQVGIGTESPDESAILDLAANDKGLLIPRLTDAEVTSIDSPVQGLLVFNKTFAKFQYYDGFTWLDLKVNTGFSENTMISNTEGDVSVTTEENLAEKRINMTAAFEHVMSIDTGVANIAPPLTLGDNPYATATARLDVDGRIKLSDDDIAAPEAGMIRWNDADTDFEGYDGTEWKSLTGGASMYGNTLTKVYPTESKHNSSSPNSQYNWAMMEQCNGHKAYTQYDATSETTFVLSILNGQASVKLVDETLDTIKRNGLYIGEEWVAYRKGTELRTWQWEGGLLQPRPSLTITAFTKIAMTPDGRIVTLDDQFSLGYLYMYYYDDMTNVWLLIGNNIVQYTGGKLDVKGDSLLVWKDNGFTTFDISNFGIDYIDYDLHGQQTLACAIHQDKALRVDDYVTGDIDLRLVRSPINNLSLSSEVKFINLDMWGATPDITLSSYENLLAIGVPNFVNDQGIRCGKVLLMETVGGHTTLVADLHPDKAQHDMRFGEEITITADYIEVNAPLADTPVTVDAGILFIYDRNN